MTETTLPERTPIDGAVYLPLNLIAPSTTNPRKHHADAEQERRAWNLDELAESIRKHGVIQPILVRPREGATVTDGLPLYDLVAGERRWRASQVAERDTIMAIVRAMTDFEVLELQVIENLQREGLHPMEEAEGYEKLLRKDGEQQGYDSVDELAARLGKSRRYVYNRLSLCRLCPEAREAFYDGKLSTSVAQAIASLPHAEQQAAATARVLAGWGGEPLTFRGTVELLKREFMLQLDKARFDITAVYQVAGPCGQCAKRSGANPDLFADVTSGDMCQDGACYQAKAHEHRQRQIDEAEAAGCTVISGDQARKLMPYPGSLPIGHHRLDDPCRLAVSNKPLRDVLGAEHTLVKKATVIDREGSDELVAVAPEAAVKKALKAKGLLKVEPAPGKASTAQPASPGAADEPPAPLPPLTGKQLAAAIDRRSGELFGPRAFARLHAAITSDEQLPIMALRLLLRDRLQNDLTHEALQLLYEARGWTYPDRAWAVNNDLEERAERADPRELAELLIETLLIEECSNECGLDGTDPDGALQTLAQEYGIDLGEVDKAAQAEAREQVQAEQQQREEAQAKAKAAAKEKQAAERAAAKKKAAAKHRTPDATEVFVAAHSQADQTVEDISRHVEIDGRLHYVGDRVRVRKTATGRKTAKDGRVGKIDDITVDGRVSLRWGPKLHERGMYSPDELETIPEGAGGDEAALPVKGGPVISPAAAWPFPTDAHAA